MSNRLADAARSTGLPACACVIDAYEPGVPPAPPAEASLLTPPSNDVPHILGQMVRRGLQPALVSALKTAWADRPVERGLLAWDALNGAILPAGALVDELRADARVVAAVLPKPGRAYVQLDEAKIDQLVATIAVPALQKHSSEERADADPPVGGLRTGLESDLTLLEVNRQWARLLDRAHLPTLASFRLADLYLHRKHERALVDLVEILLDQEAPTVGPWIERLLNADPNVIELGTYVRVRTFNNAEKWDEALAFADEHREIFETLALPPEKAAQMNPRPTLAYTQAALRNKRKTFSYEHVVAIAGTEVPWRYAFRVMLTYAATRIKDAQFVSLLGSYLEKLGNDLHAWYDPLAVAPDDIRWGPSFLATLAREGEILPHEPSVWKAAVLLMATVDAGDAIEEVEARLRAQATLG